MLIGQPGDVYMLGISKQSLSQPKYLLCPPVALVVDYCPVDPEYCAHVSHDTSYHVPKMCLIVTVAHLKPNAHGKTLAEMHTDTQRSGEVLNNRRQPLTMTERRRLSPSWAHGDRFIGGGAHGRRAPRCCATQANTSGSSIVHTCCTYMYANTVHLYTTPVA